RPHPAARKSFLLLSDAQVFGGAAERNFRNPDPGGVSQDLIGRKRLLPQNRDEPLGSLIEYGILARCSSQNGFFCGSGDRFGVPYDPRRVDRAARPRNTMAFDLERQSAGIRA